MARKTVGQVNEDTQRVETRRVKRVKEVDFPVTLVLTRGQRIRRNLWG